MPKGGGSLGHGIDLRSDSSLWPMAQTEMVPPEIEVGSVRSAAGADDSHAESAHTRHRAVGGRHPHGEGPFFDATTGHSASVSPTQHAPVGPIVELADEYPLGVDGVVIQNPLATDEQTCGGPATTPDAGSFHGKGGALRFCTIVTEMILENHGSICYANNAVMTDLQVGEPASTIILSSRLGIFVIGALGCTSVRWD